MYRVRIDSFGELPKDKQPPRNLWDKPHALNEFLDHVWDRDEGNNSSGKDYMDIDLDQVE